MKGLLAVGAKTTRALEGPKKILIEIETRKIYLSHMIILLLTADVTAHL